MKRTSHLGMLLALALCWQAIEARAQSDADSSRRNAIVRSIEQVAPSVVSINVLVQRRPSPFGGPFWEFFEVPTPRLRKVDSVGSGFIIDDAGHILTNYHVVEGADYVDSVTLPDGRHLKARYIGGDERTDIAVLQVEGTDLPHVQLGDSESLMIGEWVVAIGNPFAGYIEDAEPSVSVGVVSAHHRRLSRSIGNGQRLYQNMIQTDAAINPGNSGGPLVNANGEVVGVNTMILSPSGGSIGLGFAIPISRVRRVAEEIIAHGRRRDSWPGFRAQDLRAFPEARLRQEGIQAGAGAVVVNILRGTPAYEAGLRPGDVITAFNGQRIDSSLDVDFAIWDLFVGDRAALTIERKGAVQTISFPIQELGRQ